MFYSNNRISADPRAFPPSRAQARPRTSHVHHRRFAYAYRENFYLFTSQMCMPRGGSQGIGAGFFFSFSQESNETRTAAAVVQTSLSYTLGGKHQPIRQGGHLQLNRVIKQAKAILQIEPCWRERGRTSYRSI